MTAAHREGVGREDRPALRRRHALQRRRVPAVPLQEVHRRAAGVRARGSRSRFFGGDYDNFTYPRYDLDVALLPRLRERPAGEDRVPDLVGEQGRPRHELVLAIGSPGTTSRLLTMAQLDFHRDVANPTQMDGVHGAPRRAGSVRGNTGAEAARRASASARGIENSMKRLVGQQDGLENERLMAAKMKRRSGALRKAVAANPSGRRPTATRGTRIAAAFKEYGPYARRNACSALTPSRLAGVRAVARPLRRGSRASRTAQRLDEFRDTRIEALKTDPVLHRAGLSRHGRVAARGVARRTARRRSAPDDPFVKAALGGPGAAGGGEGGGEPARSSPTRLSARRSSRGAPAASRSRTTR